MTMLSDAIESYGSENISADVKKVRELTREICVKYPDDYWRETDQSRAYPADFVKDISAAGLLSVMIPQVFGGMGLGMAAAATVMEEINRSGGNSAACHAQLYTMGVVLRHGSREIQEKYLPEIALGSLRLQAFSVTEESGLDTSRITTQAVRDGDHYVITGAKTWTSRIAESDLLIVLARTSPRGEEPLEGMTLFLVDLREVRANQPETLEVEPVRAMFNYATNEVRYHQMRVPASMVLGEVGRGFRHVIDGWNAERILLSSEAIGDGYWFIERASDYARERRVFGRAIGENQGVQFPIADAYMHLRAADQMRWTAVQLFDANRPCGAEVNMAKFLSSNASWECANVCLDTFGGFGFLADYDVERKFRETRLFSVAPVSNNMVRSFIATKVLGLPKSY